LYASKHSAHPTNPTFQPDLRLGGHLQNVVVVPYPHENPIKIVAEMFQYTGKSGPPTRTPTHFVISAAKPSVKPTRQPECLHILVSTGRRLENVVVVLYPFRNPTEIVVQALYFTGKQLGIKNAPRQPNLQKIYKKIYKSKHRSKRQIWTLHWPTSPECGCGTLPPWKTDSNHCSDVVLYGKIARDPVCLFGCLFVWLFVCLFVWWFGWLSFGFGFGSISACWSLEIALEYERVYGYRRRHGCISHLASRISHLASRPSCSYLVLSAPKVELKGGRGARAQALQHPN
jgi:hypothetical protein